MCGCLLIVDARSAHGATFAPLTSYSGVGREPCPASRWVSLALLEAVQGRLNQGVGFLGVGQLRGLARGTSPVTRWVAGAGLRVERVPCVRVEGGGEALAEKWAWLESLVDEQHHVREIFHARAGRVRRGVGAQLLRGVVFHWVDSEVERGDSGEGQVDSRLDVVRLPDRDIAVANVERERRERSTCDSRFDAEPVAAFGWPGDSDSDESDD